jgi:hypothetical protein
MADLLDIAPATAVAVVKIDGHRYIVRGVSISAIASIVARFPALKKIASGGALNNEDFVAQLIVGCAEAVGPIIAAASGHLGEAKYEAIANALLPEQQLQFIEPIVDLSFPNGIGSFGVALMRIIGGAKKEAKIFKVRSRKLRSTSLPSSDVGSRPTIQ